MTKRSQNGFAASHLLPLVVVLAVVGGTGYLVYSKNKDNPVAHQEDAALIEELPGNLLTIQKVQEMAEGERPGTHVTNLKLEKDGEVLVYIVRLSDGTKLIYNAQSGTKITGAGKLELDDDGDDLPSGFSVALSLADAYAKALAQNPGGKLKEVELESEDGKAVYKFEFSSGSKVEISATDGSVVKFEKEDDDKKDRKGSNRGSDDDDDDDDDGDNNRGKGSSNSGSDDDEDEDEEEDEDEDEDEDDEEEDD